MEIFQETKIKKKQHEYTCKFCGFSSEDITDFEYDENGFECPDCISFNFYESVEKNNRHNFILLLENPKSNIIKPSIKLDFSTTVSPLRYPGGKSKMVGQILQHCNLQNMDSFIEPFAGGASVGLSLLLSGKIKNLYLNDLDFGIYALFWSIINWPDILINKIKDFEPSKEAYKHAQKLVLNNYKGLDLVDAGWNAFIVNRMAFSGICKANCMGNPSARWNPTTLINRIKKISRFANHIFLSNTDAYEFIEEMYWKSKSTILIDPPYFIKGKDLYNQYYKNKDHENLALLLDSLYRSMPGADMILTYDYCQNIIDLYDFPIVEEISRKYSIAN